MTGIDGDKDMWPFCDLVDEVVDKHYTGNLRIRSTVAIALARLGGVSEKDSLRLDIAEDDLGTGSHDEECERLAKDINIEALTYGANPYEFYKNLLLFSAFGGPGLEGEYATILIDAALRIGIDKTSVKEVFLKSLPELRRMVG
jgi:hypothetical protein